MKRCSKILVIAFFSLAATSAFGQTKKSVEEHQDRLAKIATNFVQVFSTEFPVAFKYLHIVRFYMGTLHDVVKVMSVPELMSYGYQHSQDVLTKLNAYERIKKETMPDWQRAEFEAFKQEFNQIEELKKSDFFESLGMIDLLSDGPKLLRELREIEQVCDITDTGIYRRAEIGIKSDRPYNGVEYILANRLPKAWAKFSRFLEDHYQEFLEDSFMSVRKMCAPAYGVPLH